METDNVSYVFTFPHNVWVQKRYWNWTKKRSLLHTNAVRIILLARCKLPIRSSWNFYKTLDFTKMYATSDECGMLIAQAHSEFITFFQKIGNEILILFSTMQKSLSHARRMLLCFLLFSLVCLFLPNCNSELLLDVSNQAWKLWN